MKGFKVEIERYLDSSESSDEPYGDWSESWTNTFQGIRECKDYPDVTTVEELKAGDTCFVVWIEWSSGDSFGNSSGGDAEALGVFTNIEDARGLKKVCEECNQDMGYGENGYYFKASTGQEYQSGFVSWSGYFESVDEIHIETCLIQA